MTKSAQRERTASTKHVTQSHDVGASDVASTQLFTEKQFRQMLCRERKRSERSRKPLVLMLIDSEVLPKSKNDKIVLGQIAEKVALVVRETDLTGWFEDGSVIGVIFTELGSAPVSSVTKIIESKVKAGLQCAFSPKPTWTSSDLSLRLS